MLQLLPAGVIFILSKTYRPAHGFTHSVRWVPAFFPRGKSAGALSWLLSSIQCRL